jgi:hypothetical protein
MLFYDNELLFLARKEKCKKGSKIAGGQKKLFPFSVLCIVIKLCTNLFVSKHKKCHFLL